MSRDHARGANVAGASYEAVWGTAVSIQVGGTGVTLDLVGWVNSGLMTFFFVVVGLEAREVDVGELRERRRVVLPPVYTSKLDIVALVVAFALFAVILVLSRHHVRHSVVHLILGMATWFSLHASGVDPVVVGLAMGLLTYADLSGVSGTRTLFLNGRRHHGAYDIDTLSDAVRLARAQATITPSGSSSG